MANPALSAQPQPQPQPQPAAQPQRAPLGPQPFPNAPPGFVLRAVMWMRTRIMNLANALVPPHVRAFEMATGVAYTQMTGMLVRHRLPDLLADGPLSAAELAARAGLDADALHRLLRACVFAGLFELREGGRFANNKYSSALRGDTAHRTDQFAAYFASESNLRAWSNVDAALVRGKEPFPDAHGMSVWDWFDAHPDERETFAQAMMGLTIADAPVIATVYPWKDAQRVCDVGGGRGTMLSELLIRHPHLRGVLCDGAGVIESARALLKDRGVLARVELVPGSFFDEVPIGADTYFMKNVLHDWDDARSLKILGTVRRAMKAGQRLVVAEKLIERNEISFAALADSQMMMACDGGRERSRDDFQRLFAAASFTLTRVFPYPTTSVLEGTAV